MNDEEIDALIGPGDQGYGWEGIEKLFDLVRQARNAGNKEEAQRIESRRLKAMAVPGFSPIRAVGRLPALEGQPSDEEAALWADRYWKCAESGDREQANKIAGLLYAGNIMINAELRWMRITEQDKERYRECCLSWVKKKRSELEAKIDSLRTGLYAKLN